ncbi:hypothetical protein IP81_14185 [Novosphingobium sp. AAP83]|nr:hypothetical protein IP81_14185 [Novosphingobium sp. AAP83]
MKAGGLLLHVEQPQYGPAMHGVDLKQAMEEAGFPIDQHFVTGVRAVPDKSLFPASSDGEEEDYGRAAIWNAYGAWKPQVASAAKEEVSA